MTTPICPCGSQLSFELCCAVFIQNGQLAPNPEALMRSRYTAFCRADLAYLQKTWHPETYPEDLGAEEPSNWVRLEILEAWAEDDEGEVEFRASLIFDNKLEVLHELIFFERIDGQWLYHSGEFKNESDKPRKIAKSEACPCGSGKTFKQCHYEG